MLWAIHRGHLDQKPVGAYRPGWEWDSLETVGSCLTIRLVPQRSPAVGWRVADSYRCLRKSELWVGLWSRVTQ